MIDPRTVMVGIPCYSGRVEAHAAGSLIQCSRLFNAVSFKCGVSHVALARNYVVHTFMHSPFQWLVFIDDDIAFHPNDFELLLEPVTSEEGITRVPCKQLKRPDYVADAAPFQEVTADADAIVCAEYSYKDDALTPCSGGLGFTRIHRSVFEAIRDLKHEDGTPRTWQFQSGGQLCCDFFPCGALFSQIVPSAQWTGEDHGFFALAGLAGFRPRIEKRTQLFHVGRKAYPYTGDRSAGAN